ncbi:YisL family protein [Paenibacillus septentrionalis]|uniref:YisL family protein n=1 Tax=Paenibacillus septentrionalis TaxID=429342 RepID=A0ABW1V3G8_9BACL
METAIYHTHASSWIILVILFVLSYFLHKNKVLPMILRLFYLIMIGTGAYMLFGIGGYEGAYHLKMLLAILLIGVMEMILGRRKRGKNVLPLWIALVILLVVVVLIGYGVISFG